MRAQNRRRAAALQTSRMPTIRVLLTITAMVAVFATAIPAWAATSVSGPSWVPAGVQAEWNVVDWNYPSDIDWGDGTVQNGLADPIRHTYASEGNYTITASRWDIDVGTVILGTKNVTTSHVTVAGPYEPGTTTPISDLQIGQAADFHFTIPGSYSQIQYLDEGNWQPATVGDHTFTATFTSAGPKSVRISLQANGWRQVYQKSFPVTVSEPATTTTTTTTTTSTTTTQPPSTTTTQPPSTTTTDPSEATTTTTTVAIAVAPPGGDSSVTQDPTTTTTLEPSLNRESSSDEEEEDLQEVVGTPIGTDLDAGRSGTSIAGGALLSIGLIGLGLSVWMTFRPATSADRPARRRWIGSGAASVALGVVGSILLVGGSPQPVAASNSDVMDLARSHPTFVREVTRADLASSGQRIVLTRGSGHVDLEEVLEASSLTRGESTRDLFGDVAAPYLVTAPAYEETILEMTDRYVVDRVIHLDLRADACGQPGLPDVVDQMCFSKTADEGTDVGGELDSIRERMQSARPDDMFASGISVKQAQAMSDEELLGVLLNSGRKSIRHTSLLPKASTRLDADGRATSATGIWNFSEPVEEAPLMALTGFYLTEIPATTEAAWTGTPETEPRNYFLTGFTIGERVADSWEYEIAEESSWHDRWYVRFEYHFSYGFGVRAPFAIDVQHEAIDAESRRVAVSVEPVNVAKDGSPAYQAVGLDSGKTFDGNEFVLELTAGCRLYASIPGPNLEQKCPDISFNENRDVPPVIGSERSTVKEWWIPGKTTGLWFDAGFARGSIDTGIGLDVTNGTFSVNVDPTSGTSISGIDGDALAFSSRSPTAFTLTRDTGFQGGFTLSNPRSTFAFSLRPAIRATVGIDVSVYENDWMLGPWSIPVSVEVLTVPLPHHSGTVGSHEYSLFGIDSASMPTAPATSNEG